METECKEAHFPQTTAKLWTTGSQEPRTTFEETSERLRPEFLCPELKIIIILCWKFKAWWCWKSFLNTSSIHYTKDMLFNYIIINLYFTGSFKKDSSVFIAFSY
jgi:hypothetical protein